MGGGGGGHQALLLAAHQPRVLAHAGHRLVCVAHPVTVTSDNLILTPLPFERETFTGCSRSFV